MNLIKTLLLLHHFLSGDKLLPSAVWAACPPLSLGGQTSFLESKTLNWTLCQLKIHIYVYDFRMKTSMYLQPQPDVAAKVWICREMLIGESNIPRLADLAKLSNRAIYAQQLLIWSLHYLSTGHASILQQVSNNTKLAWTPARYYNSLGAWLVLGGFGQQRHQLLGNVLLRQKC